MAQIPNNLFLRSPPTPRVTPYDYPVPAPQLQCTYCGTIFDMATQRHLRIDHENLPAHTPAQWDTWRIGQGYADGAPYPHWTALDSSGQPIPPAPESGPAAVEQQFAPETAASLKPTLVPTR
jgi:hypothetical protein